MWRQIHLYWDKHDSVPFQMGVSVNLAPLRHFQSDQFAHSNGDLPKFILIQGEPKLRTVDNQHPF